MQKAQRSCARDGDVHSTGTSNILFRMDNSYFHISEEGEEPASAGRPYGISIAVSSKRRKMTQCDWTDGAGRTTTDNEGGRRLRD